MNIDKRIEEEQEGIKLLEINGPYPSKATIQAVVFHIFGILSLAVEVVTLTLTNS